MKYYHVADESYTGGDLLSYSELVARGIAPSYKWEDFVDVDVVCMFDNIGDAINFREEWLPSGKILEINIPDNDFAGWGLVYAPVDEGYPAIGGRVPEKFIKIVEIK